MSEPTVVKIDATHYLIDGKVIEIQSTPGAFSTLLSSFHYTSWRTSLFGVIAAAAAFVVFSPEDFAQWPVVVHASKWIATGGFMAAFLSSKDANKGSDIPTAELPAHLVSPRPAVPDPVPVGPRANPLTITDQKEQA